MENISQMSLLEIAVMLMEQKGTVENIYKLIEEVLELKGLTDETGALATKLYVDITTSSKFVYMGDGLWDLKLRQPLEQFEKDGSSFYSKEDEEIEEAEEYREDDEEELEDEDLEDDEESDDEDEDSDDEDEELEDEDFDDDLEYEDSDDELDDSDDLDEDFDEDKYTEYMDDYEDMYDED